MDDLRVRSMVTPDARWVALNQKGGVSGVGVNVGSGESSASCLVSFEDAARLRDWLTGALVEAGVERHYDRS